LKRSGSGSQSHNQLLKIILQEDIIFKEGGLDIMDGSIQDVIDEVEELQLLRSLVSFSFKKEIIQGVTEIRSILYEVA
jgi:archaellum component FlaC